LRALLDHFRRHAHRARRDLAQRRGQHMRARSRRFAAAGGVVKLLLHALVGDEEERGAGGGAHDGAADAIVDSAEAARGPEAGRGLQAGFEGVEGEERGVDCCAC
jgi:hypothetical protein